MGAMIVLHASVTEYVIIFGTSVGTEGHTGRFFADDYFTILHGEQWAMPAGACKPAAHPPPVCVLRSAAPCLVGSPSPRVQVGDSAESARPAGALEREVFLPGQQHHLRAGQAKQYRMPQECWALEYARGNIPSMMAFGLWDTFFSTLDLVTLWQTVRISAVQMGRNMLAGKI
jgi:hypothetical protein